MALSPSREKDGGIRGCEIRDSVFGCADLHFTTNLTDHKQKPLLLFALFSPLSWDKDKCWWAIVATIVRVCGTMWGSWRISCAMSDMWQAVTLSEKTRHLSKIYKGMRAVKTAGTISIVSIKLFKRAETLSAKHRQPSIRARTLNLGRRGKSSIQTEWLLIKF